MKRILTFFSAALLLCSCQISLGLDDKKDPYDIAGYYSMVSAVWDSPVDISNHGEVSEDIRHQLLMNGWWGSMTLSNLSREWSVLDASMVLLPHTMSDVGQINLYMPFFSYVKYNTENPEPPVPNEGRCCVQMECPNFYYKYDKTDAIKVLPNSIPLMGNTFPMTDPTLEVHPGGEMVFHATTTLYDFSTSDWVDGEITIRYIRHN